MGLKEDAANIMQLFARIEQEDEKIDVCKDDKKAAIELFCENNEQFTPQQIKAGYKYFSKLVKDKSKVLETESEREKMIEIIHNI